MVRTRRGSKLNEDEKTLFSGAFWTGTEALAMGLIDDLGDYRAQLRADFGDDVQLRLIDERKSWFRRRFNLGAAAAEPDWSTDLGAGLIAAVEERLLWNRFGL